MAKHKTLPEDLRRKVAVEADCDPRTVASVFATGVVKNAARRRAYAALVRLRLIEPFAQGAPIGGVG